MEKNIAPSRGNGLPVWRHAAWILAFAAPGIALAPIAHAESTSTGIRIEDLCTDSGGQESHDFSMLRTREEIQRRMIEAQARRALLERLENIPYPLHCTWAKTLKADIAAERLLYTRVHKERMAIEQRVFGDIAARLGLSTIADLYLHTDLVDHHGLVLKRSHVIEPLTEFVRRGIDFGLRRSATNNARDYIRNTRVNRFPAYSPHFNRDIDFQHVIDVLTEYDAAARTREFLDSRFGDVASPWAVAIKKAAGAELRFAMLEALRKGEITIASYRRLVAAIDADRGDGTGGLTFQQYTLRVGRTWFSGTSPTPIQLPAFRVRLHATRDDMTADFLYVPGHPDGAWRQLPYDGSASAMILGDDKDWAKDGERGPKMLGWLASRLSPAHFHEVLRELTRHDKPANPGGSHGLLPSSAWPVSKKAPSDAEDTEANAVTRWVAARLRELFTGVPDADGGPDIALGLHPQGNRPMRFADAVEALQLSRVRSAMDPRFVGNLDADCARLEQIAMHAIEESLTLALLPFPLHGIETLQLLSIVGMMAHSTATYLATPYADANEAVALVADLTDFGLSLGLGVGAAKLGERRGAPAPVLFTPPGSTGQKLWFDIDTRRYAMPALPQGAVADGRGVYRKNDDFFVTLKTREGDKAVRVVPDGTGFRIALDDGGMGPLVRRGRDGIWEFSAAEQPIEGAAVAKLLLAGHTADASTVDRARRIMRQFGLKESDLRGLGDEGEIIGARQIMLGAVGHAFLDGLVGRLRDRDDGRWTPREVSLVIPAMARHIDRPIAILDGKGEVDTAVLADGSAVAAERMPFHALQVQRIGERYLLHDQAVRGSAEGYPSVFAAVDAATRPPSPRAVDGAESVARFRASLADSIAGTTTRPGLERMHEQWLDFLSLPEPERAAFRDISRLRHALRDRHHALTADDERHLLMATRDLLPESARVDIEVRDHGSGALLVIFDDGVPGARRIVIEADLDTEGRRVRYYGQDSAGEPRLARIVEESFSPLIDTTLNAGGGEIRHALGMSEYQWGDFADRLIERIAASRVRRFGAPSSR